MEFSVIISAITTGSCSEIDEVLAKRPFFFGIVHLSEVHKLTIEPSFSTDILDAKAIVHNKFDPFVLYKLAYFGSLFRFRRLVRYVEHGVNRFVKVELASLPWCQDEPLVHVVALVPKLECLCNSDVCVEGIHAEMVSVNDQDYG